MVAGAHLRFYWAISSSSAALWDSSLCAVRAKIFVLPWDVASHGFVGTPGSEDFSAQEVHPKFSAVRSCILSIYTLYLLFLNKPHFRLQSVLSSIVYSWILSSSIFHVVPSYWHPAQLPLSTPRYRRHKAPNRTKTFRGHLRCRERLSKIGQCPSGLCQGTMRHCQQSLWEDLSLFPEWDHQPLGSSITFHNHMLMNLLISS